jgi:cytochrome b561
VTAVLRNTGASWGAVAKFLHWTIATLIFVQFALGWTAASWRLSPTKLDLFVWHKSIGLLIFLLVLLRLLWRFVNPVPTLPVDTRPWERTAAHLSHGLLYLLMLAIPLSGWVINSAAKVPFRVFWLFPLPAIVAPDKMLAELAKQVHLILFITIATVVVLHMIAAFRHHFVKRNDTLTRMLPNRRSKP